VGRRRERASLPDDELLELSQAARLLGIPKGRLRGAIGAGDIAAVRGLRVPRSEVDAALADPPRWLTAARETQSRRAAAQSRHPGRHAAITVRVPARRVQPATVVAHLGPTNSGKTHDALAFLAERGAGVYAAPLRMLAQEAHRRLAARLGAERVGLLTGEERVHTKAPILCCTAEMAPLAGDTLVLDEVHWADDRERGSAWTTLLVGAEYRHLRLIGALDALPLVQRAFPEAEVVVHERMGALDWVGSVPIGALGPGTVVVGFSRRAVLALAGRMHRDRPGRVGALYGAMPVPSRRIEIDRFVSGETEVLAATDVLGHGVNLPCETILFAETDKFDGTARRVLEPWEVAQIAGRAGRYGLTEHGRVGVLAGLEWAQPRAAVVESALVPHVPLPGGHLGFRRVKHGRLGPRLADLGVADADALEDALRHWEQEARRAFAGASWLRVEPVEPLVARLAEVRLAFGRRRRLPLALDDAWAFALAPVDADEHGPLLRTMALAVAGDTDARRALARRLDVRRLAGLDLEETEEAGRHAAALRWLALRFPALPGVTIERAAALEEAAAARVVDLLAQEIRSGTVGRCATCGRPCAPWASRCERCHGRDAARQGGDRTIGPWRERRGSG
jgi:ATP-dependent RNA helicase SUPV3L1/SUV3